MRDLLTLSKKYQTTASKLINEKNLVESLQKFGELFFCGAYKYELMLSGDIDIYIVNENGYKFEEVLEIFNKIVLEGKFRSYFVKGAWDDPRKSKTFPNGHYIGMKEKIKGETWKLDIWFISKKELERLQKKEPKNVTTKQKELILKIKDFRNKRSLKLSGLEIYNNVQSGKWKSTKDIK